MLHFTKSKFKVIYHSPPKISISMAFISFKKEAFQRAFCASKFFSNLSRMHIFVETTMVSINSAVKNNRHASDEVVAFLRKRFTPGLLEITLDSFYLPARDGLRVFHRTHSLVRLFIMIAMRLFSCSSDG